MAEQALQVVPDYNIVDTLDNINTKLGIATRLSAPGIYIFKSETYLLLPYERIMDNFWSRTINPEELFVLQVFNTHIKDTVLMLTHHDNVPIIFHEGYGFDT